MREETNKSIIKIIIPHPQQGQSAIKLETQDRSFARAIVLVCQENKIEATATIETAPRVIKFKGID